MTGLLGGGITKLDAARRQLHVAIRLYFMNEERLAIHTLTFAALTVLLDYDKRSNAGTAWGRVLRETPDKQAREIANFLKHADRDHDATLDEFTVLLPELLIRVTIYLYGELTEAVTPEMRIFYAAIEQLEKERAEGRADDYFDRFAPEFGWFGSKSILHKAFLDHWRKQLEENLDAWR